MIMTFQHLTWPITKSPVSPTPIRTSAEVIMVINAYRQNLYNIFISCLNTYLLLYLLLIMGLGETTLQNDTFNPVFVAFYCLNSLLKPILCVRLPHLTSQRADFLQCVVLCTFYIKVPHNISPRKGKFQLNLCCSNAMQSSTFAPLPRTSSLRFTASPSSPLCQL